MGDKSDDIAAHTGLASSHRDDGHDERNVGEGSEADLLTFASRKFLCTALGHRLLKEFRF